MSAHSYPLSSEPTITSPRRPCFIRRSNAENVFVSRTSNSNTCTNANANANVNVDDSVGSNGDEIEDTSDDNTPTTSSMGASPAYTSLPPSHPYGLGHVHGQGHHHRHCGSAWSFISTSSTTESNSEGSSGTRSPSSLASPSHSQSPFQAQPQPKHRVRPALQSTRHLPSITRSSVPMAKPVPTFVDFLVKPSQVPVPPSLRRLLTKVDSVVQSDKAMNARNPRDTPSRNPSMAGSSTSPNENIWYDRDEFGCFDRLSSENGGNGNATTAGTGASATPSGKDDSESVRRISSVSSMGMSARGSMPGKVHPSYSYGSMQRLASAQDTRAHMLAAAMAV